MASFKLTTTDRRKIKKEFGERGYRLYLWLNRMNYFDTKDPLELEVIRLSLKSLNDSYENEIEI
jgi:hypothetical protein